MLLSYRLLLTSCIRSLAQAADANAADIETGETVLIVADRMLESSNTESLSVLKLLIDAGADVNARNAGGQTVLFSVDSEKKAKVLIDARADLNLVDNAGNSSLLRMACLSRGLGTYVAQQRSYVVDMLLDAGADYTVHNVKGEGLVDFQGGALEHGQRALPPPLELRHEGRRRCERRLGLRRQLLSRKRRRRRRRS